MSDQNGASDAGESPSEPDSTMSDVWDADPRWQEAFMDEALEKLGYQKGRDY